MQLMLKFVPLRTRNFQRVILILSSVSIFVMDTSEVQLVLFLVFELVSNVMRKDALIDLLHFDDVLFLGILFALIREVRN